MMIIYGRCHSKFNPIISATDTNSTTTKPSQYSLHEQMDFKQASQCRLKTSPSSAVHPDCTNRTTQNQQMSTSIFPTRMLIHHEAEVQEPETYVPQYQKIPHCQPRSTRLDRSDTSAYSALCTLRTSGRSQSSRDGRRLSVQR